uniref:Uncharacterized protein n=1 Tax=Arundo donax TaxID=35708 RepID=A0A0A8YJ45_ARUDO
MPRNIILPVEWADRDSSPTPRRLTGAARRLAPTDHFAWHH